MPILANWNYKLWSRFEYGFVTASGTETLECTYVNGVVHGQVKYTINLKASTTFGGSTAPSNETVVVNVFNGMIDGNFKFYASGIGIVEGNANRGILNHVTITADNGRVTEYNSNPNGDKSKPEIENSYIWDPSGIRINTALIPKLNLRMPYLIK